MSLHGKEPIGSQPQTSSHLYDVLPGQSNRQKIIDIIIEDFRARLNEYTPHNRPTAIACSGTSGLLVAPIVADALNMKLIVVRHDSTKRHTSFRAEGFAEGRYLILDDLRQSGDTIQYIIRTIYTDLCKYSECTGVYLYNEALNPRNIKNPRNAWLNQNTLRRDIGRALS